MRKHVLRLVPSRTRFWTAAFLACFLIGLPQCLAQEVTIGRPDKKRDLRQIEWGQGARLRVTVLSNAERPLDRQSVVKLDNETQKTTLWRTTTGDSEVEFGELSVGKYHIEVNVVGYLSAQKEIELWNLGSTTDVRMVLQRDPEAVDLNTTDALMSPQATKEMKRAVQALKSGNLEKAQKSLTVADKLAPASEPLKFLQGYLFFQKRDYELAGKYLTQATKLNPHHGEVLNLLGRVQLLRGQPDQSRQTLEQAVATDPNSWVAHNLLAYAYLQQSEYEKAREQAQMAVDKGQQAAQLALGEALAYLGKNEAGIQALKAFLQASPQSPAAARAQQFIAALERGSRVSESEDLQPGSASSTTAAKKLLADSRTSLPETTWQPPGIDSAKPVVASGVTCPYDRVVDEAGKRVEELVNDVGRFAAVEEMLHERLDELGNPTSKETRKFDYAALITPTQQPGTIRVDEFRTQRYEVEDPPDNIADNGFAALALVFHPGMRDDFQMTCEGLGELHGQATWLVHFQQRTDRYNHIQSFMVGGNAYPVNLKGRAWITADKFQIVRIESEMIKPQPEVQMLAEHQVTEYGPVSFAAKNVELWLPKTAEVYLHLRGRRYYRRHSFGNYMLFSVDTQEKVHNAKHDRHGPGSFGPRKRKLWPV